MRSIKILLTLFLLALMHTGIAQSKEELKAQILQSPNDVGTLKLIYNLGGRDPDYKELSQLYNKMSRAVKKSNEGKYFNRFLKSLKDSSIGKKALGITQFDPEGNPYSLTDLRGKYVLINFWASTNFNSKLENSKLTEIYKEFKDLNFEILAVSFDSEHKVWTQAIEDQQLDWKHISDLQGMNNAANQLYGVRVLPQNLLIDPDGRILARNVYDEELKLKLEKLLR